MAAGKVNRYIGGVVVMSLVALTFFIALNKGCDGSGGDKVQHVKIGGESFFLEVAADNKTRMKGLGGRTQIDKDGGMLFVMPEIRRSGFVMRDCPIDIDIIYLSPEGRVLQTYTMKAEPPRGPDEGTVGDTEGRDPNSAKYESRLKAYDSRYPTEFVIELAGGRINSLKVPLKEGDKIDLPYAELKKRLQ